MVGLGFVCLGCVWLCLVRLGLIGLSCVWLCLVVLGWVRLGLVGVGRLGWVILS